MLYALSVIFGGIVGFALGLTGGGGSLLAVPLLVYGLSVAPREAFGMSLAAVGATALIGVIPRIRSGQVEVGTGIIFAGAGIVGAPTGTWLADRISEPVLLAMFAGLMLVVAWQLWRSSTPVKASDGRTGASERSGVCQRTTEGSFRLTSRCALLLLVLGLGTGVLSGMFGVGGGFVIVPALVMFAGMPMLKAIATSLFVIVLISVAGVVSHVAAGRGVSPGITGMFVVGGVAGVDLGGRVARGIPTVALQKGFAVGIVVVALFVAGKTFI